MNNTDKNAVPITTEMAGHTPSFSGEGSEGRISNGSVISTLNGLIETCRDGQEGFKQAAEGVDRTDMKSLFYEYSQQRASYVGDLQSLVQTLGGDPEDSGSLAGSLHRGWINIKSAVTGKDESAILNECERGEDSAKNMYKEALEEQLPDYIRQTVEQQYAGVKEAHDRVKAFRDAFNNEGDGRSSTARTGF
ncbi:MAG: PA2169 family four-helix-bundle protein [Pyrinomonadaceae bacterium]|nr:PA2169 family four-helix-bundle protein [Pyrinomonadaceae bacterium]